jgi:hypothetical protein
LIQLRPKPAPSGPAGESAFRRVTSGLRFVFTNEILLPALALDMFAVLFGGVEAILPIFAGDILKIGPTGLGMLQAAPSIFAGEAHAGKPAAKPGRHAAAHRAGGETDGSC